MASVLDVAAYILEERGSMTAMKLQKLVYYSHAWHLVWDDEPLVSSRVEAWANGPVFPELYVHHRGEFLIDRKLFEAGNPAALAPGERASIDAVLKFYGDKSAQQLSDLTHSEPPWRNARKGLNPGEPSKETILDAAMAEYYGSLYDEDDHGSDDRP